MMSRLGFGVLNAVGISFFSYCFRIHSVSKSNVFLSFVQKLREEILVMKKYFISCQAALDSKLLLQVRDHF